MNGIEAEAKKITDDVWKAIAEQQKSATGALDLTKFLGTYKDPWLGEITLSMQNGKPWFNTRRSPKLNGELLPYKDSILIVKWTDRSMDADAFLTFSNIVGGKPTVMKMKAISPLTDFSYDFHDLDFKRIK